MVVVIEQARLLYDRNPAIPNWIAESYEFAWRTIFELALRDLKEVTDRGTVNSALAVIAMHKGEFTLARMTMCEDSVRKEMFNQYYGVHLQ